MDEQLKKMLGAGAASDQNTALARDFAAMVGTFYREVREQSISPSHTLQLTITWQEGYWALLIDAAQAAREKQA